MNHCYIIYLVLFYFEKLSLNLPSSNQAAFASEKSKAEPQYTGKSRYPWIK